MLTFKEYLQEMAAPTKTDRSSDYYYHLTRGANMNSIAKTGLVRGGVKGQHKGYDFSKKKVYLALSPRSVNYFAHDLSKDKTGDYKSDDRSLRVLRIRKDLIDKTKLKKDANMSGGRGFYEYDADIPAKDITFSGGKHYKKHSKAWQKARDTWA